MRKFRLLSVGDTIQAGDYFLTDDCETWQVLEEKDKWVIGKNKLCIYSGTFFCVWHGLAMTLKELFLELSKPFEKIARQINDIMQ